MRISIVTVSYNSSQFVESNLNSVNSQIFDDFEHIIIDGGSTDGTVDKIKNNLVENIKFVSEPDKGIYDAMNKGIKLSSGDIIGFLNSDDIYAENNVLRKVAELFNMYNVDSVYGDLVYMDKNLNRKIRYWKSGEFYPGIMQKGWMPPHPTFFVKKDVYNTHGAFDLSYEISADYELMLRLLHKNKISTYYLPEVLVKMRAGGKSYKVSNYLTKFKEDYRAMRLNNVSYPFFCLALKNISKIPQFITH